MLQSLIVSSILSCHLAAGIGGEENGVKDSAADWPAFRGPSGAGVSAADNLPGDNGLDVDANLLWKQEIGRGYSSPIVVDDLVIVTAFDDELEDRQLIALERETGEMIWSATAPKLAEPLRTPNSPVSSTPVSDGKRIVVFYLDHGLVCYDLDGKELWQHPIERLNIPHRMSSSPVLAGNVIVLQCDQDTGSYLLAVDMETGEEVWKKDRPGFVHGYATPCAYEHDEAWFVLVPGSYDAVAYDIETSNEAWRMDGMAWQTKTIPLVENGVAYVHAAMGGLSEFGAPTLPATFEEALEEHDKDGNGTIEQAEWQHPAMAQLWFLYDLNNDGSFAADEWIHAARRNTAFGGLFAIQFDGNNSGDKINQTEDASTPTSQPSSQSSDHQDTNSPNATRLWTFDDRRSLPDTPSPLLYDNVIYMIKDGGILTAVDPATGESLKRERVGDPDRYFASPIAGDGKVYLASQAGIITILKAGTEFEVLASLDLAEETWSTPALADGQLIVRTQEALYCFGDAE